MLSLYPTLILAATVATVYGFCWFASWYNARQLKNLKELRITNQLSGALKGELSGLVASLNKKDAA